MEHNELIKHAIAASEKAYAPYSGYHVGSALLTQQGNLFTGANVENSSYGATICAERSAVLGAVSSEGPSMRLDTIVVVTGSSPPAAPCGLCLQVLVEFADDDATVILANRRGERIESRLGELLPKAFRPHMLDNKGH